jgi:hypothetical protein
MIKDFDGNDVPLKPFPDINQDPLCDYRYKYTSADGRYYILVIFVEGVDDGMSYAHWSKYSCIDDDSYHEEGNITLGKDFIQMMDSEEWIDQGYEIVPCQ